MQTTWKTGLLATVAAAAFMLPPGLSAQTPDVFEPDNYPWEAKTWSPSFRQNYPHRNFHDDFDVDWIKVYLPRGEIFDFVATQVGTVADIQMQIFFKPPERFPIPISSVIDQQGVGGEPETYNLQLGGIFGGPPQGFYYIRLTPTSLANTGDNSDYDFTVLNSSIANGQSFSEPIRKTTPSKNADVDPPPPPGNGYFICTSIDRLITNMPPPDARCIIDGVADIPFTNQNIYFTLTPGIYTIRVTTADGVEGVEDPDYENQIPNPTNEYYGNPKIREVTDGGWDIGVYQFTPYGRLDAEVRDEVTGEFIEGAEIIFEAESGILTNNGASFDGYQDNTAYKSNWFTDSGGIFPTNVHLPTTNWHMTIQASGYDTTQYVGVVSNLVLDEERYIGTYYLRPYDGDSDGLADSWEYQYYGHLSNSPSDDIDGDGKTEIDEYLDGTNPTNAGSYFGHYEPGLSTNFTLTWHAAAGRSYMVQATDDLPSQNWSNVSDTMEATPGQTNLSWGETNMLSHTGRHYLIRRVAP